MAGLGKTPPASSGIEGHTRGTRVSEGTNRIQALLYVPQSVVATLMLEIVPDNVD